MNSKLKIIILFVSLYLAFNQAIKAQGGYSSASYSINKAKASENSIPLPEEIVVEEYMNYYRHRLPLPRAGEAVALDVRWGNTDMNPSRNEAVLQIGFTTEQVTDYAEMPQLNLGLVIDRSGSMEGKKLEKLKEALCTMVDRLRPNDLLTIVAFDTEVQVLMSGQKLTNKSVIKQVIEGIRAGGSTNIHGGLMQCYEEVTRSFNKRGNNSIILFTDGRTNYGVTKAEEIIEHSRAFNDKGINLSVIGIGNDLDYELLKMLAKTGKGAIHFIGDEADIQKVFITELESLLSPIARNVKMELKFDDNLELSKIFGYSPQIGNNEIKFDLENMNSGLTQVVILQFVAKNQNERKVSPVSIRLNYFDIVQQKSVEMNEVANITFSAVSSNESIISFDRDVKKNYTIALMAQCLKDMAKECAKENTNGAKSLLTNTITMVKTNYPSAKDEDINRVLTELEKYDKILNGSKPENKR